MFESKRLFLRFFQPKRRIPIKKPKYSTDLVSLVEYKVNPKKVIFIFITILRFQPLRHHLNIIVQKM